MRRGAIERIIVDAQMMASPSRFIGEIVTMVRLAANAGTVSKESHRRSVKMVAGVRNHLYRTRVEFKPQSL